MEDKKNETLEEESVVSEVEEVTNIDQKNLELALGKDKEEETIKLVEDEKEDYGSRNIEEIYYKKQTEDTVSAEEQFLDEQIKNQNEKIEKNENVYEVGTVTVVKDFILEVTGLESVQFYEKVNIGDKGFGYVSKIEKNFVTVSLLHKTQKIVVGDSVFRTNEEYKGEFSKDAIGRIIDIFGTDKLNNKKYQNIEKIPIEIETFPIMDRTSVRRPMFTGIAGIDLIYPIGRGQRQLIIGDKKTGKTQICLDTIVNQKGKNMICIYVAIGKTKKEVKELYYELLKREAMNYTIIVTAFNDDLPPAISFTPYYALSVAANYLHEGYNVF